MFLSYIILAVVAASLLASVSSYTPDQTFAVSCIILGILLIAGIVIILVFE